MEAMATPCAFGSTPVGRKDCLTARPLAGAAALVREAVGAQPGAVLAVVGALPRVVRVAVRRTPVPEVAAPALAAPAVETVGAGSTAPEGAARLQALAGGAALHAPGGPRGPAGASRGGRLHRFLLCPPSRCRARGILYCCLREIARGRRARPVAHCHGRRPARGILAPPGPGRRPGFGARRSVGIKPGPRAARAGSDDPA